MGDYGENSFQLDELMSKILRLKNINNNSQEGSCCELNGCHAMKPCDDQSEGSKFSDGLNELQEALNENNAPDPNMMTEERFHDEEDIPAVRSNESSSSNSTGNLSFSQYDYGDDDEVIFLANQQYVDDDVSEQSDDCVYAYRGADFDAVEPRNNNNIDDETDFLEMDFEPDPASEVDNASNECHNGCRNHNPASADEILSPIQLVDEPANSHQMRPTLNSNHLQNQTNGEDWRNCKRNLNNISADESGDETSTVNFKLTGAKPKKQLVEKNAMVAISPSPRKQMQPDTKGQDEIVAKTPNYANGECALSEDGEEPCIDCLEREFVSTTMGRKLDATYCKKCRRRTANGSAEGRNVDVTDFGLELTFNEGLVTPNLSILEPRYPNLEHLPSNQNGDNLLLKRTGKESVTVSSVNIDEKVIIQALDHINVSFDRDMIKTHFENESNFQPHFDNVTELILYTSKRNCDYKRIIKLIKLACNDEVEIRFTRDENVSKETEIVQVRSCDILETWTIQQQNLEQLKRLNKKFIQMNVLGKVINLIRHAQQRNTKSIEEYIKVPQYYKTGYICITKK